MRHRISSALALAIAAALAPSAAHAQTYPSKPLRLIVPFAAGGSTDVIARTLAQKLNEAWGQPAIVENRAGGGSTIGTELAAKAPPDGHTLLVSTIAFAIGASLQKNLRYHPLKDFTPVTQISSLPLLLVVHPALPVKSVKELVQLARGRPGQLSYASSGSGTSPHLAGEMLKTMARIDLVHIPYKGNAPAMNDLLGGHVMINIGLLPVVLPHVNAGKLRALAATTTERVPQLPSVPTMAESGLRDYEINSWQGVWLPGGAPAEIVSRVNREIVRILRLPDVQQRITNEGGHVVAGTPEQFSAHVASEIAKWATVVKQSGARAD